MKYIFFGPQLLLKKNQSHETCVSLLLNVNCFILKYPMFDQTMLSLLEADFSDFPHNCCLLVNITFLLFTLAYSIPGPIVGLSDLMWNKKFRLDCFLKELYPVISNRFFFYNETNSLKKKTVNRCMKFG